MSKTLPASRPHRMIDQVLAGYVERGEIPGIVYGVSHQGVATTGAVGSLSFDGPAITENSIFRISSLTKPVTAVAMLLLVEDGAIGLDDPIGPILPELDNPVVLRSIESPLTDTVPAVRAITVRDLLTCRLGTGVILAPPGTYPIQNAMSQKELAIGPPNPAWMPSPDKWIGLLGELPLIHQPGEGWLYDTGFDVLGVLISRLSGMKLGQFLDERLFTPLGMTDTGFHVPAESVERFVVSYGVNADAGTVEIRDSSRDGQWSHPPEFHSGSSGLVSTIADFHRFAEMLLNHGEFNGQKLLSASSIEEMTRNHLNEDQLSMAETIVGPGSGWGFGVGISNLSDVPVDGRQRYGWSGGLGTHWFNDPAGQLVALLFTQVDFTSPASEAVFRDFCAAVHQETGN